jgi:predicted peroxiredoxin
MCIERTVIFTRHPHAKTITTPSELFIMKAKQAHRHGVKVTVCDYERCPKFNVKDDKIYGEIEEILCLRSGAVGKKLLPARR